MKPYTIIRKAKGYCCRWDDGSYSSWKKKTNRLNRRRDRAAARDEITAELNEYLSPTMEESYRDCPCCDQDILTSWEFIHQERMMDMLGRLKLWGWKYA